MFKSSMATSKQLLMTSLRGLIAGYCDQRYNQTDLERIFLDGALSDDEFLYYLGEQNMTLDQGNCTVIDFADDLQVIHGQLEVVEDYSKFVNTVMDEFLHGEQLVSPFDDLLLHLGNVMSEPQGVQQAVLLRLQDVTEQWNHTNDPVLPMRGRGHMDDEPLQAKKYAKVMELNCYALQPQPGTGERYYVPLFRPVCFFQTKEGNRFYQQAGFFDDYTMQFLYPKQGKESIEEWEQGYTNLAIYAISAFMFLYKHQRVEYREIEPPAGLQKKRRKKNLLPYERYYVSKLGCFHQTVYSESKPSEDPQRGVAMHIKRGHWRLKWGHRKLPVEQQERVWRDAVVAGDPRYGIIIRDYETDLLKEIE